jgi:predicted RNA-binding Zn-ribbon protein involved in translation (DUF1610 family)
MNKSRPIYAPFRLDVTGRAHLIITDQPEFPPASELAVPHVEIWVVKTIAPGVQAPPAGNVLAFRAVPHLFAHLRHRLAGEAIGLRLYAAGTEAFLWDAHNLARACGLGGGEIHLTRTGEPERRVYCTHCQTMIEGARVNIITCPGCRASLFVRDHFSRRLAAFMGVKVDAEVPGDVPAPELLT